ncbi:MAG: hormogonium polysaccharide biosynthesis protein HpsA [Trichodesmium sp. MAG_R01]|nr:hormogonium polysaccharide biosynthesis protein HpsA [Trichodesmium sp. MAG_R01]
MYYHRILKNINSRLTKIRRQLRLLAKGFVRAIAPGKQVNGNLFNAGFVLPTATMVMLAVVLLTSAILLRSFDRAEQASKVTASQEALSLAAPALDRAEAKLQYLLREDPTLPRGQTPSERGVDAYLSDAIDQRYKFPDERRLKVTYKDTKTEDEITEDEITTAWMFPFDANGDGDDDHDVIYGIYLKTPLDKKAKTPLQARTPPVTVGALQKEDCSGDLSSTGNGWYKNTATGDFIKSFFVYAVAVPKQENETNPSIAALEYQEDWKRVPLSNNAVVYQDDLEISPGPAFRLNGRIVTNSNLVVSPFKNALRLYQVSSNKSCFYQAENSKIIVGGNVVNGMSSDKDERNSVEVDLFQGQGAPVKTTDKITTTDQSVNNNAFEAMYNNNAYSKRIEVMVDDQMSKNETQDPKIVKSQVDKQLEKEGKQGDTERRKEIRRKIIGLYFRDRTRGVTFAEVGPSDVYDPTDTPENSGNTLKPPDKWILPTDAQTKLSLKNDQLKAREPDDQQGDRPENFLGERILVGNNLPVEWWDGSKFVFSPQERGGKWLDDDGNEIDDPLRTRKPRVTELPDVGSTDRGGFWEKAAAQVPEDALEGVGGLRIITGAGVYERETSPPQPPGSSGVLGATYDDPATPQTEQYTVVWPDTMPMFDPETTEKRNLKMRATVLYHYARDPIDQRSDSTDNQQAPIACISSYYDPTSRKTAENRSPLPDVGFGAAADGNSNNGVVYPPPKTSRPTTANFNPTTDLFSTSPGELGEQANMVFPNGRFANEPLRKALRRLYNGNELTLAEQAAIDSTLCSLDILDGTLTPTNSPSPGVNIEHGVIKEVTLLDARQIKAIDADNLSTPNVDETFTLNSTLAQPAQLTTNYDLPLEWRQPLEIRLTQLDLGKMRNQKIEEVSAKLGGEYLLPYSGIIYASRDDALPDRSDRSQNSAGTGIDEDKSKALSPTDYKLDPTRRPNGIMLINGERLARNDNNDDGQNDDGVNKLSDVVKEKGLTLVTNLPVYIKGNFNLHTQEEFNDELTSDWSNFYTRTKDKINLNFACRPGDPRLDKCKQGDSWRPATVLSDAITLLSEDFRTGFRDEGDFDLRNNAGSSLNVKRYFESQNNTEGEQIFPRLNEKILGFDLDKDGKITDKDVDVDVTKDYVTAAVARMLNGFYENNFVTNGLSSGADITGTGARTDQNYATNNNGPAVNSSYFNNYVTPVQRRGKFPEYVMEICREPTVFSCGPGDWFVGNNADNGDEKGSELVGTGTSVNNLVAGTTARPPLEAEYRRYPRRVAFARKTSSSNELILDDSSLPIPIGIDNSGLVNLFPYNTTTISGTGTPLDGESFSSGVPRLAENALWFRTSSSDPPVPHSKEPNDHNYGYKYPLAYLQEVVVPDPGKPTVGTVQQPLLIPVLQNYLPTGTPEETQAALPSENNTTLNSGPRWLTRASGDTTFNLIVGSGDVPPRPGESNGGLQNLPRFLENWAEGDSSNFTAKITGSFMQLSRSAYATAPYPHLLDKVPSDFGYPGSYKTNNYLIKDKSGARVGYFLPPDRNWGYDVGLLSQPPDYFSQLLSGEDSSGKPDRYYREVNLDDRWVQTLLCSKVIDDDGNFVENATDGYRPEEFCDKSTK